MTCSNQRARTAWPWLSLLVVALAAGCGGEEPVAPPGAAKADATAADVVAADAPDTPVAATDAAGTDGAAADTAPDIGATDAAAGKDADNVADSAGDTAADTAADTGADSVGADAPDAATDGGPADAGGPDVALPACVTDSDCISTAPCLFAKCAANGTCVSTAKASGAACDDGNACTTADTCQDGFCNATGLLLCDDANPCTVDGCNPIAGCLHLAVAASAACDDGEVCTLEDTCKKGVCSGVNTCQCKTSNDCGKFDDGDLCNGTSYCDTSSAPYLCKTNPATVVSCPITANSACQTNKCIPATGACKIVVAPTNSPCQDGNPCTEGDSCQSGLCEGGTNTCFCSKDSDCAALEDGDKCNGTLFCNKASSQCQLNKASVVSCPTAGDTACLKNLCNPKEGKCHFTATHSGKPCDDGNVCTPNETCAAGKCHSDTNACECVGDADCKGKEDGNLCNGSLFCASATKKCTLNPATIVTCPTGDDPACLVDTCDPKTGKCSESPVPLEGKPCDDGNACTAADACMAGACTGGTNLCPCQGDGDCKAKEDGNLCNGTLYCNKANNTCTVNAATLVTCSDAFDETCLSNQCDPVSGKCGMKPDNQGNACSDGSLCSAGGWCKFGVCEVEATVACECVNDNDCAKLEDGNACNGTLYCDKTGGKPKCAAKPGSVVVCKTAGDTACLKSQCQPGDGSCKPTAVFGACNDDLACTVQDNCSNGACKGAAKVCSDGEGCTSDTCAEPFGCQFPPLPGQATCTDDNACTTGDKCGGGNCIGAKKVCDDGNACTNDSCAAESGCVFGSSAAPCSDGDACTPGDACVLGLCKTGAATDCDDDNLCTADLCDKGSGKCGHLDTGSKVCGDGNPCTDDGCHPVIGCSQKFNTMGCNDKNPCTSGDACNGGTCAATSQFQCSDGKLCTTDSCDPKTGCVFAANSKSCDDGDPCTPGDACKEGLCIGGAVKTCDDKNACTADVCDPKTGACGNTPTTDSCSDGNACTGFDQCGAGKCLGKEVTCDDGNGCTHDACDVAVGCVYVANKASCDLGACKQDDVCSAGNCTAGSIDRFFTTLLPLAFNQWVVRLFPQGLVALTGGGYMAVGQKFGGSSPSGVRYAIDGTGKQVLYDLIGELPRALGRVGGQLLVTILADGKARLVVIEETGNLGLNVAAGNLTEGLAVADLAGTALVAGVSLDVQNHNRCTAVRFKADLSTAWGWQGLEGACTAAAVAPDQKHVLVVGSGLIKANALLDGVFGLITANGGQVASWSMGGADNDIAYDVTPVGNSGFLVVGSTASKGAGGSDGWLVRVDPNGTVLWERTVGTAAADVFRAVVATADGFVVAGSTTAGSAGGSDNWLVGIDRFGNVRWERTFGSGANDTVENLLLDGKGEFVGSSAETNATLWRRDRWGFGSCAAAGACKGLTGQDCDDGNPCTVDTCSPTGGCKSSAMAAGSQCSDSQVCSGAGVCAVPTGMVEVPAGPFWMGCIASDINCASDEKPQHEVTLSAYAIDNYEGTVAQYVACVASNGCTTPGGTYAQAKSWNYGGPGREEYPINGISLAQAKTFCAWQGKRLPTEAEWEKAARGGCEKFASGECQKASITYPWGMGAASCSKAMLKEASFAGCGTALTAPVGSRPAGVSPYGAHDMAGNVAEWVSDHYNGGYYAQSPPKDPQGPSSGPGVLRGGGYSSGAAGLRASSRLGSDAGQVYTHYGVRCAVSLK